MVQANVCELLKDVRQASLHLLYCSGLKCCLLPRHQKFTKAAKLGIRFRKIHQFEDHLNLRQPSCTLRYFKQDEYNLLRFQEVLYLLKS